MQSPDSAEELVADAGEDAAPSLGLRQQPVVGLGGSAGAIPALVTFMQTVRPSGLAYVVILHLSPEHESTLAELLQQHTRMRVVQVRDNVRVLPDTVYVIPPRHALHMIDGELQLGAMPVDRPGRVAVDLFFRTLADSHGPHATAIVLSGLDSDGAIGIKRIKERGGLTIAQDPAEAQHDGMPRAAISTGMVDWVLPVADMARRVASYVELERRLSLPPEKLQDVDEPVGASGAETELREVLTFLRTRTGRDFGNYKRATILRRIGRRMQVNGVQELADYLGCLHTRPGEAGALLQDLLISVTNFFRDSDCFDALERQIAGLFHDKTASSVIRVWVAACATGEEAYSIAMMLSEHARMLDAPPAIQIFATDLDEEAIRAAREGVYPPTIAADVSEERLRRFFTKEHRGYRVRRELREQVLFAAHDMLKDSPFSRLDLISCRNLLIYLNRDAQRRVFETAHFALVPGGRMFLGASETVEDGNPLFLVIDKKNRIYAPRPVPRMSLPMPSGQSSVARAIDAQGDARSGPVVAGGSFTAGSPVDNRPQRAVTASDGRAVSWADLHFRMLEALAPPSIVIDADHEIMHLSPNAGRYLQYGGGEPSRNLLQAIHPALRIELRAAIYQVSQSLERVEVTPLPVDVAGEPVVVRLAVAPMSDIAPGLLLVSIEALHDEALPPVNAAPLQSGQSNPLSHLLDRELERLKSHLRDTVEQYEASTEELKASNEELQAMNEELRSATEELETSREELQSINEELTTVNQELKSNVDELGHANSDMHNLMDATAIATVFLDRELCVTRYTPSAVSLFNLIPTDVGRPLTHLANHLNYPQLDVDARRVLQALIPIEREVDDASGRWYLARLLPYRTSDDRIAGIVLALVDITDRKRNQEALRISEERLRLIVDNASEYAIFAVDRERYVTSWNSGAERLLGWTGDDILGQQSDVVFTDDERAHGVPAREAAEALARGRAVGEREHQRKNGERFWATGALMPMRDERGTVLGFVKILRDQTVERQSRERLAESRKELEQALVDNQRARRQLESADLAKDRFLSVLSHELRNPLAAIAGAQDVLSHAGVDEASHARAQVILATRIEAMKTLLDGLLDVSHARFDRLALNRQMVPLASVVEQALETARPVIEHRRHELRVRLPDVPVMLCADRVRLGQALSNLLVNAATYTDEGGHIELSARREREQCIIDVVDDGRGLDDHTLASMFDLFRRSGAPDAGGAHGMDTGLGLVRSVVSLHGGSIGAASPGPGCGSTMSIRLPIQFQAAVAAVSAAAPVEDAGPGASSVGRVLIVDDDEDVAWTLGVVMEAAGFEARTALEGRQAVALVHAFSPEAVVVDIAMPGMSGRDMAERLRAAAGGRRLLLIAATGRGSESDRQASASAGFDAHLTKPVSGLALQRVLARLNTAAP